MIHTQLCELRDTTSSRGFGGRGPVDPIGRDNCTAFGNDTTKKHHLPYSIVHYVHIMSRAKNTHRSTCVGADIPANSM